MPASERPTIQPQRLRQLLRKMVDIYSPTGKEEDLISFLQGYLKRHGLPAVRQSVDEDRDNLVVEPDDVKADLVLVGHVDTVLAYDLEQYYFRQEEDEAFGLGTSDMKGGCAAMIEAYMTLWEAGYTNLPVALAMVVGEEEEGDGASRLVREFDFTGAIVGEPTHLEPCLSHYGYLEMQLTTGGRRVHASMAKLGRNAVTPMLKLLLKYAAHLDKSPHEPVYNIRDLASSRSGFAVPDFCEAWVDMHLPAGAPMGEITAELEELLAREQDAAPNSELGIQFNTIHAGYKLPEKGPLVETLKKVYAQHKLPFHPTSFRSHSDANILWAAGVKPILLGPGYLEKAHTPTESIDLNEVYAAAQLYVDIALDYAERMA